MTLASLLMKLPNKHVMRPKTWEGKRSSWLFGMVVNKSKGGVIVKASANSKYPIVYRYLQDLIKTHDEHFPWTTINVNRNIECKNHIDKNNLGDSIIVGLGDYCGGEFVVKKGDLPTNFVGSPPPKVPTYREDTKYDIKGNFVRFCGKTQYHSTEPFKGERYSIVYFSMFTQERFDWEKTRQGSCLF